MATINAWGSEDPVEETKGGTGTATYAAGDILYASASNTLSKLAKGSDAEVLTLASGLPSWAASGAGGGAWDFVSTTTASNDASVIFTDLTLSSYMIIIEALVPATASTALYMTVSNDNGLSYASADYQWGGMESDASSGIGFMGSTTEAQIEFNGGSFQIGTGSGNYGFNMSAFLYNLSNASEPLSTTWSSSFQETDGDSIFTTGAGISADDGDGGSTLDVDAIKFAMSSGNITSGKFHLYSLVTS